MIKDNKYAIRKTKLAVGSVLIASTLIGGTILPVANTVVSAETILRPRGSNIYEGVTAEYREGSLFISLPDNVEYKAGDTFEIVSSVNIPAKTEGTIVNIVNEDTGKIINVGTLAEPRTHARNELDVEEDRIFKEVGFEGYSQNKFLEALNKIDGLINKPSKIQIVLNGNINQVSKNRVLKIPIKTWLVDGVNLPNYSIVNPLAFEEPGVFVNESEASTSAIRAKIEELDGKTVTQRLSFNGREFLSGNVNIVLARWSETPRNKAGNLQKTGIGLSERTLGYGLFGLATDFDPNEDYIRRVLNVDLGKGFNVTATDKSEPFEFKYDNNYTIPANGLEIRYKINDSPLMLTDKLPKEVTVNLTGQYHSTASNTTMSTNNQIFKNEVAKPENNAIEVPFTVEKISETEVVLKNKNQIQVVKDTPVLRVDDLRLGPNNTNGSKPNPSQIFKFKENWQSYVNYETGKMKHSITNTVTLNNQKTLSKTLTDAEVSLPALGWGENTKGTVILKYEDANGNKIKEPKTLINNQVWRTKYTVDPKNEAIAGYKYKGLKENSKPLSGIAGNGERVVTLVYAPNVRYVEDPTLPGGTKTPNQDGSEIRVGTKPKVTKVPFNRETVNDPTKPLTYREVTTPGVEGEDTTTYTVDPATGNVTEKVTRTKNPVNEITTVGTGANKPVQPSTVYQADPNSPVGTRQEVPGRPGTADVTGRVIEQPTPTIVKVGTKTVVEKEPIPFKTEKRNNDKVPVGKETVVQQGKNGERVTTKTYTVNEQTGQVSENVDVKETPAINEIIEVGTGANKTIPPRVVYEANPEAPAGERQEVPGKPTTTDVTGKVLEEGTPTIIKVGTKTVVEKEPIPFKTEKRNNDKVPVGKETVIQQGKNGERIITKTYTVNPETGETTENVNVKETPPVNEIIEVGTGANKTIPPKVVYEADPELPNAERKEIPGKPTITDVTGKILEEGTPTVIKVGTKTTVTKEDIPNSKTYVENPNEESGKTSVKQQGKVGTKTTTTTYTVDPTTGKVTSTDKVDIVEPVEEIIQVGTKTKVSTTPIPFKTKKSNDPNLEVGILRTKQQGKDGTKTITTTYRVNPKTGKVTEQVDTKVIPSVDEVVEVGTKEIPKKEEPKKVEVKKEEPKKELPKTGSAEAELYSLAGYSSLTGAFGYLYSTKKKKRNK